MSDSERERLRHLREKQLRERDPGDSVKVKWKGTGARRKRPLFQELFGVLPRNVQGGLIGLVIGIFLMIGVQFLITNVWHLPPEWSLCGIAVLAVAVIVGMVIGRTTDLGGYAD